MPLVVRITEGLVREEKEAELMGKLINTFLDINNAGDNVFLRANFIGEYRTIPVGRCFVGDAVKSLAAVELKIPTLALREVAQRSDWVAKATAAVLEAGEGKLSKEQIWVNLVYGDGMWGIAGRLYSDEQLGVAIEQSEIK